LRWFGAVFPREAADRELIAALCYIILYRKSYRCRSAVGPPGNRTRSNIISMRRRARGPVAAARTAHVQSTSFVARRREVLAAPSRDEDRQVSTATEGRLFQTQVRVNHEVNSGNSPS